MSNICQAIAILVVAAALPPSLALAQLKYTGVNLAGAEFAPQHLPGVVGQHYDYPTAAEVDHFMAKGMNVFRLPFRWERLQRMLGGEFHSAELALLDGFVTYATGKGAHVILDPHNYARYRGTIIGTGNVTNAHFADFWSRLAKVYKDNDRVIFGLVNEPYGMPSTEHWVETANAAIAAIRATGAKNLILVPGNAWTGAHSWEKTHYGTPNGVALLKIVDPANHYAFDVHQYLDADSSGSKDVIVSPEIGAQRLETFTRWAKEHRHRAFLGEFAVANAKVGDAPDQIGDEAIDNMLDYMEANDDVWLGFAWWAAGPRWGEYMFSIEPKNLSKPDQTDRPAMAVLEPHLAGTTRPAAAAGEGAGGAAPATKAAELP